MNGVLVAMTTLSFSLITGVYANPPGILFTISRICPGRSSSISLFPVPPQP